ncbi:MAG: hypothetical protein V3U14_12820 [candidate division NC10 bacterium]
MALTFTKTAAGVAGDKRYWFGTVAFDSSYPTGGEAVAVGDFEMELAIDALLVGSGSALVFTKIVRFDPSTSKLTVGVEDGTSGIEAQAGSTSDQSGLVDIPLAVWGA